MPADTVSTMRPAGEVVSTGGSAIERRAAPASFSFTALSSRCVPIDRAALPPTCHRRAATQSSWLAQASRGVRPRSSHRKSACIPPPLTRRIAIEGLSRRWTHGHSQSACREFASKLACLATDFRDGCPQGARQPHAAVAKLSIYATRQRLLFDLYRTSALARSNHRKSQTV